MEMETGPLNTALLPLAALSVQRTEGTLEEKDFFSSQAPAVPAGNLILFLLLVLPVAT